MELTHQQTHQQLVDMAVSSQDVLMTANTVWPFSMFKSSITVDRFKVTIHKQTFIWTSEDISIKIEDISNIEIDRGPFLAAIKIYNRWQPAQPPIQLGNLPLQKAQQIKVLIQGYSIARTKEIDCSHIPKNQLLPLLNQLGQQTGA